MSEQEQQNPDEQAAQEQAAPPSEPTEQPTEQPTENTVKLKYNGPPGQSVVGLGAVLVPGESYDVPEGIADSLIAGSSFWEK